MRTDRELHYRRAWVDIIVEEETVMMMYNTCRVVMKAVVF